MCCKRSTATVEWSRAIMWSSSSTAESTEMNQSLKVTLPTLLTLTRVWNQLAYQLINGRRQFDEHTQNMIQP